MVLVQPLARTVREPGRTTGDENQFNVAKKWCWFEPLSAVEANGARARANHLRTPSEALCAPRTREAGHPRLRAMPPEPKGSPPERSVLRRRVCS